MSEALFFRLSPALEQGLFCKTPEESVYLMPCGGIPARGVKIPAYEVLIRTKDAGVVSATVSRNQVCDWAESGGEALYSHVRERMLALEMVRRPFGDISLDQPVIMGILNVTPDSFSDGGAYVDPEVAVAHALEMVDAGATIIDVGGESTRPGALPVTPREEIKRVVPVIRRLSGLGLCVSADTRRASVMREALDAGAKIVNDVSALEGDDESLQVVAQAEVPVILMHMRGDPRTMQDHPVYGMAVLDVFDYLRTRIEACLQAGIKQENICIDPGLGFGKTVHHNVQLLRFSGMLQGFGCPVLLGVSRKSFIGQLSCGEPPGDRLGGSIAAVMMGITQGVQIVRVHDVAQTAQALAVFRACQGTDG